MCNDGPALATPYEHQFVLDRIRRAIAQRRRGGTKRSSARGAPRVAQTSIQSLQCFSRIGGLACRRSSRTHERLNLQKASQSRNGADDRADLVLADFFFRITENF